MQESLGWPKCSHMASESGPLETAVEPAHIGLAELDAEGCFISANSTYLSMLGLQSTDLLGRHWRSTVHLDDRARVEEAYRAARSEGRGCVEIRAVRNNARIVYQALTVTGNLDAQGAFVGYNCRRHAISDYMGNQEALMLAVESAPNGLLMLNSSGVIQFANRAVENIFGYTRQELIGRTVETLLPDRFRARHQHQRKAFSSDESRKAIAGRDLSGLRKDGAEVPVQVQLNRIETDMGDLILCTVIDIAERIKHQKQLELAKQAAEAANRAKSDFLARMSHEIRTPMNLIMGMNALLLESPLNGRQRQHVEISYRNVRRLLRLINGILDLSKVEAGMLTLSSVAFDLHHVLEDCAATISTAVEKKGLQLEVSIHPEAGRFWIGDSERLQQVLLNLIGNSVKFTEKGKITVEVEQETGEHGEKGLRFAVTDTGCGIPADSATMIFDAFQQVDGAMNRPYEGTGLGLTIARTIVGLMGGKIWVDAKAGPGTRLVFTAFFPEGTENAVAATKLATAEAMVSVEAGTRVLVVEDNPENVILLQAYLENLPVVLDFASNGVQAIDRRRFGSHDLILMDIQMPVMDGYAATREIRAWEKEQCAPRVPIVALTAHALTGASVESLEAGCDGHLTKPVDQRVLIEAIAKFAKRQAQPNAAIPNSIVARRPAFLANRRVDLAKMRNAAAAGDFSVLQTIAHNWKGTGVGYGFPEITRLGTEIELAAKAADGDSLPALIEQVALCLAGTAPITIAD